MGSDEKYHCEYPVYICSEYTRRVAGTSPVPPMAPQRHPAVLWVLARYVTFRMNQPCHLTQQDLMDFVRISKWKMYQLKSRSKNVANFLTVLDMQY